MLDSQLPSLAACMSDAFSFQALPFCAPLASKKARCHPLTWLPAQPWSLFLIG